MLKLYPACVYEGEVGEAEADERPLGPADALRVDGELGERRGDEWLGAEGDIMEAIGNDRGGPPFFYLVLLGNN